MEIGVRSAQFAPFAALVGYDDMVEETARLTDEKIEIDDEVKASLDDKLQIILDEIKNTPFVSITFFTPDKKKKGGEYTKVEGNVKKIDFFQRKIILVDGTEILMSEIVNIEGKIFDKCER